MLCANSMFLDSATVESNFQRFLNRVVHKESVFYLSNRDGVANSVSYDDDETTILMFWSDRAYAKRANKTLTGEYSVIEMSLFEFMY